METLARFLEELQLGVVDDPHTNSRVALTEKVTVCPACRSLHTLREEHGHVFCLACAWAFRQRKRAVRTTPAA
ncbi:MAG TPA: hypothetical protein PLZ36_10510 [Armatimonadota bacterium]|nr:hypothetical protein [Armatimonadota bacterium]HOS43308.1 hypothetical protein [Armatimonadota bacterium]